MVEALLWAVLIGTALGVALAITSLFQVRADLQQIGKELRKELRFGREEDRSSIADLKKELASSLQATANLMSNTMESLGKSQQSHLETMAKSIKDLSEHSQRALEKVRSTLDVRVKELQEENSKRLVEARKDAVESFKAINETLSKALGELAKRQQSHTEGMTKQVKELASSNQIVLEGIRTTLDARVKELQQGNEQKLEQMRRTVDEKLHNTLEKRLGESFKLVSDRLESVHKGLGEMQALATGVGDLKRVLTNVKARGTWAEVQLGVLLEQILAAGQYERNVCVKSDSSERVEYAIRLPGSKDDPTLQVWLPIDSKFPQEDYVRLQEAAERADADAVQAATDALTRSIRNSAKTIHDKYINPPTTTDFAIMFLATEGLYAEVLRQPALIEELQHTYRVVIAGPTTVTALLNSLRVGFQTLAIEKRASEVWRVLAAVKTEFGKFGSVLDKVKRQLNTASRTIEQTGVRSRALERHLRSVEQLPDAEASELLTHSVEQRGTEEFDDGEQSREAADLNAQN